MSLSYEQLGSVSTAGLREAIRSVNYCSHTAGLGAGYLQANIVILPVTHALDFMRFCQRNPKPCPLVGVSETGDPMLPTLGANIDIRTDLPAYNIYRSGSLEGEANTISDLWRDDLVTFALGCSFTFENAVQKAGIALWHVDNNTTVPMFRTNVPTVEAGPFRGTMAVSMRSIPKDRVDEVIEISRKYPLAHGGPVHVGDPSAIGIDDISRPQWGDPAPIGEGEVPVFWACGVTPQIAVMQAKLPFCITHKPGHMLITDIAEEAEVPVLASANAASPNLSIHPGGQA